MRCFILCILLVAPSFAEEEQANPMRKIINLLQEMRKQVEADGEKRQTLFDAFMCYCDKNIAKTQKNIEDSTETIDTCKSTIEELSGSNEQLKAEVKEISGELAEDEEAVKEATKVRKGEADAFAAESADMRTSIAALDKAIPALRKGLETSDAAALLQSLRGPLLKGAQMAGNREEVMALIQGEAPAGGSAQILGIIEQMRENFKENLEKSLKEEEENIATYDQLMGSKGKEITAAKKELETKKALIATQVQGIADAKEEMEDTQVTLATDQKFLLGLKKTCATETKMHEAAKKSMMEEMKAIQETIKILNDDDALETFKKTVPQAESFLQVKMSMKSKSKAKSRLRLMSGSTQSKPDKFAELKKMIAKMIADMKQEQVDDDNHRKWCTKEFDLTEDSIKVVQEAIDTHNQKISEKNNELASLQEGLKAVKDEITDLDNNALLAGAQRSKEKAEYDNQMSEITIALSLLKKARDRMAAFYEKPSFVQEAGPPSSAGFSQVESMFGLDQPAPPSAAAYTKKSGQATGILGMLDNIRQDLKVEQKTIEMEEKEAVKDYEEEMAKIKESKTAKEKDVIFKEGAIGRVSEEIQVEKKGLASASDEMISLRDKESALHESCDFLLANYDIRKKARSSEIEGLQKSVAILSGAGGEGFGGAAAAAAAASLLQIRSSSTRHKEQKKAILDVLKKSYGHLRRKEPATL